MSLSPDVSLNVTRALLKKLSFVPFLFSSVCLSVCGSYFMRNAAAHLGLQYMLLSPFHGYWSTASEWDKLSIKVTKLLKSLTLSLLTK